jgi:hypothetical protein
MASARVPRHWVVEPMCASLTNRTINTRPERCTTDNPSDRHPDCTKEQV